MRVDELDEWQGLTAELVQQWAEAHGYQYRISGLVKGGYVSFANPLRPDAIVWLVPLLADRAKLSLQAFLREINPRMSKGMPSQEAINAHADRHWVAKSSQRGGVTRIIEIAMGSVVMVQTLSETQRIGLDSLPEGWHYWPCDDHGNKVRWPTDAKGEML